MQQNSSGWCATRPIAAVALCLFSLVDLQAQEPPFGLPHRVPWTTSRMVGSPDPPAPYITQRAFPNLQFDLPIDLVSVPGTHQLLVVELKGRLWSFAADEDTAEKHLVADLTAMIPRLNQVYGFAFHPKFASNRHVFVCYVLEAGLPDGSRVSRFRASGGGPGEPLTLDPKSEEIVLTWRSGGHNGGSLQFGPRDGCLYISTGDGSSPFPPDALATGQDIGDLLSSILRIDVDRSENGRPYSIPKDNPFVAHEGARGEVWSYGLRNPWRMSFDPVTSDLWVGDVGWEMFEMIYRVERGANYGWSLVEHTQPVNPAIPRGPTPLVPPTAAHAHTESRSITGGYVYRGTRLPELIGSYVYGDYVTGKVWGLATDSRTISPRELVDTSLAVICFGVDHARELLIVGYDGTLHRLVPNPEAGKPSTFPTRLSETGLFASTPALKLAPGVLPYDVNAAPWEDGATAVRFVALPGRTQLGVHKNNNVQVGDLAGEWSYPDGAVLGKTVLLEQKPGNPAGRRRLETQILHRHNQQWQAFSYIWNDEQTDAVLSDGAGFDRAFDIVDPAASTGKRRQTWHFAGRTECLLCHTTRGGSVYGFRTEQLNRDFDYRDWGGEVDNQLRTLAHIGLFLEPLGQGMVADAADPHSLPRMISSDDATASLTDRVRSYLHVNCSHCHRRGGGGTAAIELTRDIPFAKTGVFSRPTQGMFGIVAARVVTPGRPEQSVLFYRMAKLGRGRMPHFGSQQVDQQGLRLVHACISDLQNSVPGAPLDDNDAAAAESLRASNENALRELASNVSSGSDSRAASIERMLSSTSGALRLVAAMHGTGTPLEPDVQQLAISAGIQHSDPLVRDLFEPFVSEERRARRLGTLNAAAAVLAMPGDRDRGRQLFFESQSLQCRNCHRIDQMGRSVGPDLDAVGKRLSRAEILDSILEPSRRIDPKFQTWLLETRDGRIVNGLLVERSEARLKLRDAAGRDVEIASTDVELLLAQPKSLMPELLLRDLTPEGAADLLAFLDSLR